MPAESYKHTKLWKSAFSERVDDAFSTDRLRLSTALDALRERAGLLANEIAADLRDLTIHDLSHSDALWEVAEAIAGDRILLNPLEAFVLGATFLMHDLGMGLAAYPEGLDSLRKHRLWLGMLKSFFKRHLGRSPDDQEIANPPEEVLLRTQFEMLRILHAERAESLVETKWIGKTGVVFHLLDDADIRLTLGHLIGRISHSHWWPVADLPGKFPQPQGAPVPFPKEWHIDSLRIALMLRTADSAHIDARRAPAFLRVIRKPQGTSDLHWAFQEKLYKVRVQEDRLLYSGRPFGPEDAEAWWLCVDTLRSVDKELRHADNLLSDRHATRFQARGVVAVDDPATLSSYIPATGWNPVDTRIHVSNVASLVSRLGGEELYGNNNSIPLRELVQNAADAVDARRVVTKSPTWGRIILRTGQSVDGAWIEIEDNGIGMSQDTLTGPFLDFGKSFWSSSEAVIEFPELSAMDFRSIGRYGIGFFSVFMWGDRVSVASRRFDSSVKDTRILVFNGIGSRPILRAAEGDECLSSAGTRVRVWVRGIEDSSAAWVNCSSFLSYYSPARRMSPPSYLAWLCVGLDIEITYENNGVSQQISPPTDWRKMRQIKLGQCSKHPRFPKYVPNSLSHIRPMRNKDVVVGRAAIERHLTVAWIMVGGMRATALSGMIGLFEGEPRKASRDEVFVNVPRTEQARWAEEQARLILKSYTQEDQAECSRQIAEFGGSTDKLAIGRVGKKWLSGEQIQAWASRKKEILLISLPTFDQIDANLGVSNVIDNVIFEPNANGNYQNFFMDEAEKLNHYQANARQEIPWYEEHGYYVVANSTRRSRPVLQAIAKAWGTTVPELFLFQGNGLDIGKGKDYLVDDAEHLLRRSPIGKP